MTDPFKRETARTFVVIPDFPVIVALCGEGEFLRSMFKKEREEGKIVIILTENADPALNEHSIALADELFILNLSGQYDDFQSAMYLTAQKLQKHIRVLRP